MSFVVSRIRLFFVRVANVVLPGMIADAEEADDGRLSNTMKELYAQFPLLSENEITRAMRLQLFGHQKGGASQITGVRHQQGVIHLNKSVCRGNDCDACLQAAGIE